MGYVKSTLTYWSVIFASAVCLAQTPSHGIQEFTGAGRFIVPPGVSAITVELWGAGGGGGGGTVGGIAPGGGGGGGGSGAYLKTVLAVQAGQSYDIETGIGGGGGNSKGGRSLE